MSMVTTRRGQRLGVETTSREEWWLIYILNEIKERETLPTPHGPDTSAVLRRYRMEMESIVQSFYRRPISCHGSLTEKLAEEIVWLTDQAEGEYDIEECTGMWRVYGKVLKLLEDPDMQAR